MAKTDAEITIRLDGSAYTLRAGEVNALDASMLRRATGLSVQGLFSAAATDPDIDVIAAVVWMARRQAGETTLMYETVARQVTYDSDVEAVDEAEDDPKADLDGRSESSSRS